MRKVLIIDDSEASLFLLQSVFIEDREVKVIIENKSSRALAEIKKEKPDVILLDLMMPHVDGFKILENIQKDETIKNIPVIIISARYDEESYARAKTFRVFDYIKKPIDLHEIRKKVYEALVQH